MWPYNRVLDFDRAQASVRLIGKDWEVRTCAYIGRVNEESFWDIYFWRMDFEHIAPYLGLKPAQLATESCGDEWREV